MAWELRAATAVALLLSVQVVTHVVLLILFSAFAGASGRTCPFRSVGDDVYAVGGALLAVATAFVFGALAAHVADGHGRPCLEVLHDMRELASDTDAWLLLSLVVPQRTLGGALALWACIAGVAATPCS